MLLTHGGSFCLGRCGDSLSLCLSAAVRCGSVSPHRVCLISHRCRLSVLRRLVVDSRGDAPVQEFTALANMFWGVLIGRGRRYWDSSPEGGFLTEERRSMSSRHGSGIHNYIIPAFLYRFSAGGTCFCEIEWMGLERLDHVLDPPIVVMRWQSLSQAGFKD